MKKILKMSEVNVNNILRVLQHGSPSCFCIVQSCVPVSIDSLNEREKKALGEQKAVHLKMIEFNENSSEWSMLIPESTNDSFISIRDDSFNFTLHRSSLEEVKESFKELENVEITDIFKNAILSAQNTSKKYKDRIEKTLNKLVK